MVNPLVPYANDFETRVPTIRGSRPRRVSDMGFPHIGYQVFKLLAHQRLHELARGWEERAWRKILGQTTSTLLRQAAQ